MKCDHCSTRIAGEPFTHEGLSLCCECMSELCSWLLDGGFLANPDQFDVTVPT